MSYLFCITSIYEPYTNECLASLKVPTRDIFIVDNTINNRGCSGGWNLGIDKVIAEERDWFIICSPSIRFGEKGGMDFVRALEDAPNGVKGIEASDGLGWHLFAIPRDVLQKIGYFDELFYPAYHEDNDYSWRIQVAYGITPADYPIFPKVETDATLKEVAHGIKNAHISVDFTDLANKYIDKWGGESGSEKYKTPYNDPLLTYRHTVRRRP